MNGAYLNFLTAFFVVSMWHLVKNSLFLHLLRKKNWKFAIISVGRFEDLTAGVQSIHVFWAVTLCGRFEVTYCPRNVENHSP